ncbi:MAG: 16S rRNA (guanine(527)-N(7))-methyltransferase RsmG [Clostridia bacterium]
MKLNNPTTNKEHNTKDDNEIRQLKNNSTLVKNNSTLVNNSKNNINTKKITDTDTTICANIDVDNANHSELLLNNTKSTQIDSEVIENKPIIKKSITEIEKTISVTPLKAIELSEKKDLVYYLKMFADFGIVVNNDKLTLINKYYEMLVEYNNRFNLTSVTDFDAVMKLHFLDSMLGIKSIPQGAKICDVGSGAGFPGAVIALMRNDVTVTLMDSLTKRISFLEDLVCVLRLKNVNSVHIRAEDAGKINSEYREKYDVVTARAVAKLNTLAEYCLPLVRQGGRFIAYKSEIEEEATQAKSAIKILGGVISEVKLFTLPDGEKRSLVIITKTAHTPLVYPRGLNKPRSKPL